MGSSIFDIAMSVNLQMDSKARCLVVILDGVPTKLQMDSKARFVIVILDRLLSQTAHCHSDPALEGTHLIISRRKGGKPCSMWHRFMANPRKKCIIPLVQLTT